jgi:hypothetical protein
MEIALLMLKEVESLTTRRAAPSKAKRKTDRKKQ